MLHITKQKIIFISLNLNCLHKIVHFQYIHCLDIIIFFFCTSRMLLLLHEWWKWMLMHLLVLSVFYPRVEIAHIIQLDIKKRIIQ